MNVTLIVLAKRPVPGRVKTRLVPPLSHAAAAGLAAAALTDTIRAVTETPAARRMLAFDGPTDGWICSGWSTCAQPGGGLDMRLAAAFASAGAGPALLVGMDTPQVQPGHLTRFDPSRYDACLGRSPDGGYWAIGFREPDMAKFSIPGVPMSRTFTADAQLMRLRSLGLRVQELDELLDVDTIADARAVADAAPQTRFAAELERVTRVEARAG